MTKHWKVEEGSNTITMGGSTGEHVLSTPPRWKDRTPEERKAGIIPRLKMITKKVHVNISKETLIRFRAERCTNLSWVQFVIELTPDFIQSLGPIGQHILINSLDRPVEHTELDIKKWYSFEHIYTHEDTLLSDEDWFGNLRGKCKQELLAELHDSEALLEIILRKRRFNHVQKIQFKNFTVDIAELKRLVPPPAK
jgi:hypothetical protein